MGAGSEKMHFWTLPKLGSYLSVRMQYDACLNEKTLDEAVEKEASLLEQKQTEEEAAASAALGENPDEGDAAAEAPVDADGDEGDEKVAEDTEAKEPAPVEMEKIETEEEKAAREILEAAAKATAEELYLVSHLEKLNRDYCVCLDTLGNGRRFSDDEVIFCVLSLGVGGCACGFWGGVWWMVCVVGCVFGVC